MATLEPGGNRINLVLEKDEALVVTRLLDDMIDFLDLRDSEDDIEKRLFPKAYEEESEAQKFNEMVGDELRANKVTNLETMRAGLADGGGRIELSEADAEVWLRGLTDLRLALGTRLDVTEEKMAEIPEADDPEAAPLGLLHWLGWLQEMMIDSLAQLEDHDDETRDGNGGA